MGASVRIGGDEWGVDDLYIVFVADWVHSHKLIVGKLNPDEICHCVIKF